MRRLGLALIVLVFCASAAFADAMAINTGNIKWGDAPPIFPTGAKFAVISGDPGAKGIFVVRIKLPANYRIPAHNHPMTEYVTVISGALYIGMGWMIITVIEPLAASVAAVDFWLLVAGGLVYSAGIAFYVIERIPFHKAIWHTFVLTAAVLHFSAVALEFSR